MPVDLTVIATALISGLFGVLVATVPKWAAYRLKKSGNGDLMQRSLELRQLEVEADARLSLWENQKEELGRLRERVASLEEKEHISWRRGIEYDAIVDAMEVDLAALVAAVAAFRPTAEREHVETLARNMQVHVRMAKALKRTS